MTNVGHKWHQKQFSIICLSKKVHFITVRLQWWWWWWWWWWQLTCCHRADIVFHWGDGHTRLTHSHLLSGEPPPICSVCQIPLTVQHFMLDCPQFTVKRAKYFTGSSLKDLFYHVNTYVIVDFIKDIGFYDQLWYHISPSLTLVSLIYILL